MEFQLKSWLVQQSQFVINDIHWQDGKQRSTEPHVKQRRGICLYLEAFHGLGFHGGKHRDSHHQACLHHHHIQSKLLALSSMTR